VAAATAAVAAATVGTVTGAATAAAGTATGADTAVVTIGTGIVEATGNDYHLLFQTAAPPSEPVRCSLCVWVGVGHCRCLHVFLARHVKYS
jgi:hypothetical protein